MPELNLAQILLADESATLQAGSDLAAVTHSGIFYLQGDLGAGKTCLVRGYLTGCGYSGRVKSPTYTLIEPYEWQNHCVYHFDLYRLADPEELHYLGIDEYHTNEAVWLIEWPEKGGKLLPEADVIISLTDWQQGRKLVLQPVSEKGEMIVTAFRQQAHGKCGL